MNPSPRAGQPAGPSTLVNVPRLMTAYYTSKPDPSVREQRVAFGTSGHRGSAFDRAFNEAHVDRKSTRLNSSHIQKSRMPSSA